MIQLKSAREIELMAQGGRILGATLDMLRAAVHPGRHAPLRARHDRRGFHSVSHEGATPAFKGLYGFPGSICTSVNQEIVHGIPSPKRVLRRGRHRVARRRRRLSRATSPTAPTTVPVGDIQPEAQRLLDVTQEALDAGIGAAQAGNHVGDIGAAVQGVVEAAGFSVVRDLVGHGIGVEFHEEPQVPNYGKPKRREKLVPGLTLAIEPMVNIGGPAHEARWAIGGRSSRSTARCRRTSSTRWRSRTTGRWC